MVEKVKKQLIDMLRSRMNVVENEETANWYVEKDKRWNLAAAIWYVKKDECCWKWWNNLICWEG